MGDLVNHPNHYTDGGIEPIDFIEANRMNFNIGNVIKYVTRAGKKSYPNMTLMESAIVDLNKAKYYIERQIMFIETEMNTIG